MKKIFILGGTLGTQLLDLGVNPPRTVWADKAEIMKGSIHSMRLAADGINPGPPHGAALLPGPYVPDYMHNLSTVIAADLNPSTGWEVEQKPYDWRKSIESTGAILASQVTALPPADLPVTMVCHSQGGLVARACWRALELAGLSAKVRRIITMGTPHYGAYPLLNVFLGIDPWVVSVVNQINAVWQIYTGTQTPQIRPYTAQVIGQIAATWPAYYEMLPFVGGPGPTDPQILGIFNASNYGATMGVSQSWLDHARLQFQGRMTQPSSFPPTHVMTCFVAGGTPTWATTNPFRGIDWRRLPSQMLGADGDGRVIVQKQQIAGAKIINVTGEHGTLPDNTAILSRIVAEITEERAPPDPAPPPTTVQIPFMVVDPSFPLPPTVNTTAVPFPVPRGLCPGGVCRC